MLVLSRSANQSVVFPQLGITVQVNRVNGRVVSLGIDAPKDILVVRDEMLGSDSQKVFEAALRPISDLPKEEIPNRTANSGTSSDGHPLKRYTDPAAERTHALRNRLNVAMLHFQLLQSYLKRGESELVEKSLDELFQSMHAVQEQLGSENQASIAEPKQPYLSHQKSETPFALIVDDNSNEAELLAQFLNLHGYETQVVSNGNAALEWLHDHRSPDVVLMDMNMPELDGPATIQQIRKDSSLAQIRVFGVSGMDQTAAGVSTGVGGVDRWFTKPVDARKLVAELQLVT